MTTNLKAKLLQHFAGKKANSGFTLIELLVVIIIIGILSAIALPSFLNQANKAKQSEAKTYVGSMNRAQQAYYLENSRFINSIPALGLGVASSTANYVYSISGGAAAADSFATSKATALTLSLKGYAGGVGLTDVVGSSENEKTTSAVLCEASTAGIAVPSDAVPTATAMTCAANMKPIK